MEIPVEKLHRPPSSLLHIKSPTFNIIIILEAAENVCVSRVWLYSHMARCHHIKDKPKLTHCVHRAVWLSSDIMQTLARQVRVDRCSNKWVSNMITKGFCTMYSI